MEALVYYILCVNVLTFIIYGVDKWKARHAQWRIPEATLLGLAVIGGSIGAWLGMKVWHHKTLHNKFRYGVPLILILQIALLLLFSCGTRQKAEINAPLPVPSRHIQEHSPTVFLVMYDEKTGKEPLLKAIRTYKADIKYDYKLIHGMALKKPDDKTLEEAMQHFRGVKGVTNVDYDHVYRLTDPVKPKLETK